MTEKLREKALRISAEFPINLPTLGSEAAACAAQISSGCDPEFMAALKRGDHLDINILPIEPYIK